VPHAPARPSLKILVGTNPPPGCRRPVTAWSSGGQAFVLARYLLSTFLLPHLTRRANDPVEERAGLFFGRRARNRRDPAAFWLLGRAAAWPRSAKAPNESPPADRLADPPHAPDCALPHLSTVPISTDLRTVADSGALQMRGYLPLGLGPPATIFRTVYRDQAAEQHLSDPRISDRCRGRAPAIAALAHQVSGAADL
jgi:hypothetical protein